MKRFIFAFAALFAAALALPASASSYSSGRCPAGQRVDANELAMEDIPEPWLGKVMAEIRAAQGRESYNATYAPAYQPDAVSRTYGSDLRGVVLARAPVDDVIIVNYRRYEGRNAASAPLERTVGQMQLEAGRGTFVFPADDGPWLHVTEFIWPRYNVSPVQSGGEARLWVFPYEWGPCEDHILGITYRSQIPRSRHSD